MNRAVLPSLCKTPWGPNDWEAFAKWLQYTLCNAQKYGKCDESDPLKNGQEKWVLMIVLPKKGGVKFLPLPRGGR